MASRAAESSLNQLNKFEYTVNYALDLHDTVRSLLNYCFGLRDLTNVFTTATKDPDQVNECREIAQRLIIFVTKDIAHLVEQKKSTIGLSSDDEQSLLDRIILFWELYRTREIEVLYDMEDLDALDTHMEMIEKTLIEFGYTNSNRLPHSLHQHLHRGSPIMMDKPVILPLFIRTDDVNLKQIVDRKPESTNSFIIEYEKIVAMLNDGRYDFEAMNEAAAQSTAQGFRLTAEETMAMIEKLLPHWNCMLGYSDLRVRNAFIGMLEKFFSVTTTDNKNAIFERVILHGMTGGQGATAQRDADIEGLDGHLTEVINMLGDHNDLQANVEKFEIVRAKLLWYLLMAPLNTLKRILVQCVDNKLVVPAIMKVLHSCSSLFCLEVTGSCIGGGKLPILIHIIDHVFVESPYKWDNVDMQDSFVYVVTSLARRKRTVIREKNAEGRVISQSFGEATEDSLLNGAELVSLFLLPHLLAHSNINHKLMMLKIMQRVFQTLGAKDTEFKFTSEIGASWKGLRIVPAPDLVDLLHRLYSQSEQQNQPIADICRAILKALGDKLREDGLVFTSKTTSYILDSLVKDPWWLRYAMVEWFSCSLSSPKHQLPAGLFAAVPLEVQERCEQLSTAAASCSSPGREGETAPVACWLRSLFEMGLFDVDLAMDLLNHGLSVRPQDDHLMEQMALSLVDSCGRSFRAVRIVALAPLFDKLIAMLDPSARVHQLEFFSEATFHGLRLVQSILLVAKAAKMAYAKAEHSDPQMAAHYTPTSLDRPGDPSVVADELLKAFCEMAKAHMESEMVALRRSQLPVPPEIREPRPLPLGVEMQRDERVLAQLTMLFSEAVIFTRIKSKDVPSCIRVLIPQLSDYLREVQEKQSGRFLDCVQLPQVKNRAVYAYAKPAQPPATVSAEPSAENAGSNQSDSYTNGAARSPNFVENKLFDDSSAVEMQPGSSRSPTQYDLDRIAESHQFFKEQNRRRFVDPHSFHPDERQNWQASSQRHAGSRNSFDNNNWPQKPSSHGGRGDSWQPRRPSPPSRQSNYGPSHQHHYQDHHNNNNNSRPNSYYAESCTQNDREWNARGRGGGYGGGQSRSCMDGYKAVAAQIDNPAMRNQTERRLSERTSDSRGGGWQQGSAQGNWRGSNGYTNDTTGGGYNRGHGDGDNESVRSGGSRGSGGGNKRNNRNKKR